MSKTNWNYQQFPATYYFINLPFERSNQDYIPQDFWYSPTVFNNMSSYKNIFTQYRSIRNKKWKKVHGTSKISKKEIWSRSRLPLSILPIFLSHTHKPNYFPRFPTNWRLWIVFDSLNLICWKSGQIIGFMSMGEKYRKYWKGEFWSWSDFLFGNFRGSMYFLSFVVSDWTL